MVGIARAAAVTALLHHVHETVTERGRGFASMEPTPGREVLRAGALEVRPQEYVVRADGRVVAVSLRELELLVALARRPGRVVPRAELYATVWGAPLREDDRSVDVYVHKLRLKLAAALPDWTSSTRTSASAIGLRPSPSKTCTHRRRIGMTCARERCRRRPSEPRSQGGWDR